MNPPSWNYVNPAKAALEQMDQMRRLRGGLLDSAGFAPIEAPYQVLQSDKGVTLRKYMRKQGAAQHAPVMLIVPAPIKRPYIWDLAPQVSVVRRCLDQGMRVYLAEWNALDNAAQAEHEWGLADYADRLLKICVDAIDADGGQTEIILAGHSLGGILATLFACLYPGKVRALVLLETPLHFGADAGSFAPLVAATPDSRAVEQAFGRVPGSFLNMVSVAAAPHVFQWESYVDLSLCAADREAFASHMRVQRWMLDEFPLPGKLFTDIVELLYRQDQLMQGSLSIGGRQIGPHHLKAPLLNVVDPRSTVIPPQSILPFHEAAGSRSKQLLQYDGDIGVAIQHVGVLVGKNAHADIWPAIFRWLSEVDVLH